MNFSHKIVWLSFGLYVLLFPGSTLTITLNMVPTWGIGFGAVLMLLQGSATLGWLLATGGWRGGAIGLLCLSFAWLIEYIGETSGLPFGRYAYTEVLQPQIAGVVPLPITFAWLMVVAGAWQLASMRGQTAGQYRNVFHGMYGRCICVFWGAVALKRLLRQFLRLRYSVWERRQLLADGTHSFEATELLHQPSSLLLQPAPTESSKVVHSAHYSPKRSFQNSKLKTILITATLVLLLDLQIETVATLVNPYWIWLDHGPYYGIPTANFVAWWLVGLCMAIVLTKFGGAWKVDRHSHIEPERQTGNDARDNPHFRLSSTSRQWMTRVFEHIPSLLYVLSTLMFIITNAAYGYWMAVAIGISTLALLGMWIEET